MKLYIEFAMNEDGTYTAYCPSLPGCVSRGPTREEAREKIGDAIQGYMAAIGNFVPENVQQMFQEA